MPSPPASTDALPDLALRPASNPAERLLAYRLITDSIAQQRQSLNRCILSHPTVLSLIILLWSAIIRLKYSSTDDLGTVLVLLAGVTVGVLALVQRLTADYLEHAERMAKKGEYEKNVEGEDRETVVAIWGGEVVGAVVLRFIEGEGRRVEVWAWTVVRRYRGAGLGSDLLHKAVEVAKERHGSDCEIRFAEDHANSYRIDSLPRRLYAKFDRDERRIRKHLAHLAKDPS